MISYFLRLVSQRQPLIIFAISCQRCFDPIPFIHFNPQLIEGVSPREMDDLKKVELILQTKQYLASQVNITLYILVICHYCRM